MATSSKVSKFDFTSENLPTFSKYYYVFKYFLYIFVLYLSSLKLCSKTLLHSDDR